jgi:hypothetical protein
MRQKEPPAFCRRAVLVAALGAYHDQTRDDLAGLHHTELDIMLTKQ